MLFQACLFCIKLFFQNLMIRYQWFLLNRLLCCVLMTFMSLFTILFCWCLFNIIAYFVKNVNIWRIPSFSLKACQLSGPCLKTWRVAIWSASLQDITIVPSWNLQMNVVSVLFVVLECYNKKGCFLATYLNKHWTVIKRQFIIFDSLWSFKIFATR